MIQSMSLKRGRILRCVAIFFIPAVVCLFLDRVSLPVVFGLSGLVALYEVAYVRSNKIFFAVSILQLWWVASAYVMSMDDMPSANLLKSSFIQRDMTKFTNAGEGRLKTISVVLPCSGEGEYARKTVASVYDSMPEDLLEEIIVVDDNSDPPLEKSFLDSEFELSHKLKVLRQNTQQGLIKAKLIGGNAAKGDIIVFFDCHVAPQANWYEPFFDGMNENYKRMIIPSITDLDVDTWTQRGRGGGVAKCYITFDADFKWFDSDNNDVPALSGGLLGISKRWWIETGGYDTQMVGWGGENIDQSFRTWLCGGEMKMAPTSQVAHMWRMGDKKTSAHYTIPAGSASRNRMRAAAAWMGPFAEKIKEEFPIGHEVHNMGDLSNILKVQKRLECKPFAWYLHRFRNIYIEGGLVPEKIFALKTNGGCLRFMGSAGTSGNGRGMLSLDAACAITERHRFHATNRIGKQDGAKSLRGKNGENNAGAGIPLSGIRAWNTDQCFDSVKNGGLETGVCSVAGDFASQHWRILDGKIRHARRKKCLSVENSQIVELDCSSASEWEMFDSKVPREWAYFEKAKKDDPHLFKD
eukprot:GEMP01024446.1.p1 GENE.GEMP01024446.1~~GEMP01024446.1.p1  ORF type:complete len:580 (+),score=104.61 GEMP01024446.1:119-1858(+)